MTLEAATEDFLIDTVQAAGGICVKLAPRGLKGIFDRLIVLPGPRIIFCEVKRPKGGRMSPHQGYWARLLTRMGCEVARVNTRDDVLKLIGPSHATPVDQP